MTRVVYLRKQAALLRRIARTFDIRSIRDRILALAEECLQLAKLIEKSAAVGRASAASARASQRSRPGAKARASRPARRARLSR
jgi:hypothetical protein